MCEWGSETAVRVKVLARVSHSGSDCWKVVGIDRCIAPIVAALQSAGIDMIGSCCGHGRGLGRIDLSDGRILWISAGENREREA